MSCQGHWYYCLLYACWFFVYLCYPLLRVGYWGFTLLLLNSPTFQVLLVFVSCIFFSVVRYIYVCHCFIFWLIEAFIITKCPFCIFSDILILKPVSVLSDMIMTTPPWLQLCLCGISFFILFVATDLWFWILAFVSCGQHVVEFCF